MAKTLYMRRFGPYAGSSGNLIYKFANGVWTPIPGGSLVAGNYGWNDRYSGFTVYRGVLYYVRARSYDNNLELTPITGGSSYGTVITSNPGAVTPIPGAPIEYKGMLVWMWPGASLSNTNDVRALTFDGSSARVSNVIGGYASQESGLIEGRQTNVLAFQDRLVMFNAGVLMADPNNVAEVYGNYTVIDPGLAGVAAGYRVSVGMPVFDQHQCSGYPGLLSSVQYPGYENWDLREMFRTYHLGMFTFKDKLYRVGLDACIYEITALATGDTALRWDLKELVGWPAYVKGIPGTATSSGGAWVLWDTNTILPDFVGAKVTSTATGTSYLGVGGNTSYVGLMDLATHNVLKYGPAGGAVDTITIKRGFGPGVGWGGVRRSNFAARTFQTFEYGGYVYILSVGSCYAGVGYTVDSETSPTYLIKWDGSSAPTFTVLTVFGGLTPDYVTCDAYFDSSTAKLHLVGVWRPTEEVVHAIINIPSMVQEAPYSPGHGVFLQRRNNDANEGAGSPSWYWAPGSNLIGFNANEGDTTIESTTVNTAGALVTVIYKTYSADSHAVTVTVEVNNGGDWVTAAAYAGSDGLINQTSSPTGVSHTFIHNAAIQFPGSIQSLQYRIRAV